MIIIYICFSCSSYTVSKLLFTVTDGPTERACQKEKSKLIGENESIELESNNSFYKLEEAIIERKLEYDESVVQLKGNDKNHF